MGDMVLVEGMPVGGIFAFFWNLLSKVFLVQEYIIHIVINLYLSHSICKFPICGIHVNLFITHFTCIKGMSCLFTHFKFFQLTMTSI